MTKLGFNYFFYFIVICNYHKQKLNLPKNLLKVYARISVETLLIFVTAGRFTERKHAISTNAIKIWFYVGVKHVLL